MLRALSLLLLSALIAVGALAVGGCSVPDISYPAVDAGDAGDFTCLPNLDGVIDADELQVTLGLPVSYVVSTPGTVNLVGTTGGSGVTDWDFSASLATDVTVTLEAMQLAGKWYEDSFPTGQWAAALDVKDTLEGVYSADSTAIYLQGYASTSPTPANTKTLIVYGMPVAIYRFPLQPGFSWTSTGTITGGLLNGLAYVGTDTYQVGDDALGELDLHDYTFTQVHRVRTKVTVAPSAGEVATTLQTSFLFECFGEIVRATSKLDETNVNFTDAAEVRRFASQ
jgi:hypothetical protein